MRQNLIQFIRKFLAFLKELKTLDRIKYILNEDLEFRLNNKINNKIFN